MAERRYFGKELAERVERLDQVKVFDLIYTRCDLCGGETFHRGWLTSRNRPTLSPLDATGWVMMPTPRHALPPIFSGGNFIVADSSIPDGYVWKVVDELRDDASYERELAAVEKAAAHVASWKPIVIPEELLK